MGQKASDRASAPWGSSQILLLPARCPGLVVPLLPIKFLLGPGPSLLPNLNVLTSLGAGCAGLRAHTGLRSLRIHGLGVS